MTKKKPKILITNDDGINAPGIRELWQSLKSFADVTIVAPAQEQSAVGLSVTLRHPLLIEENHQFEKTPAWAVTGTPADCVKMALKVLLESPPDLIVSGINRGCNAGRNVLYSGTVGGVIEGTLQGIPGIAFSCRDYFSPEYQEAGGHVPVLVNHILNHPLPEGTLLNVNFPYKKHQGKIKGIKLAKQGKSFFGENLEQRHHPAGGHPYYWLGIKLCDFQEDSESDVALLEKGYIAAVPIHINTLTDEKHFEAHKTHFEETLNSK